MSIYYILGILVLTIVYFRDRHILRFDFEAVKSFIGFMVLFSFFRIALASFSVDFGADPTALTEGLDKSSFWRLLFVFWEDAVFAIPIYYMKDKWQWSKWAWIPIVVVMSALFGLGHAYQGNYAIFVTMIVPYMYFYRYGVKYGFRTSMTCHILFDMFTLLTVRLMPYIL